ncbi:unnamed protein product [Sphagnum jensenii]|uniref:Uncharacterized protein n=1 Tax=Sphagnum jensenii TaxID=128206 RepID=A0ABP0VFW0_9BRYO
MLLIVQKHRHELAPMLWSSGSDGCMLNVDSLDLTLLDVHDSQRLLGVQSVKTFQDVYTRDWLNKNKHYLRRKLGLETSDSHIVTAYKWDDAVEDLITEKDVQSNSETLSSSVRNNQQHNSTVSTNETWLARLLRYLTVGLLDDSWEVRHGSALGLLAVLKGVSTTSSDSNSMAVNNQISSSRNGSSSYDSSESLPMF